MRRADERVRGRRCVRRAEHRSPVALTRPGAMQSCEGYIAWLYHRATADLKTSVALVGFDPATTSGRHGAARRRRAGSESALRKETAVWAKAKRMLPGAGCCQCHACKSVKTCCSGSCCKKAALKLLVAAQGSARCPSSTCTWHRTPGMRPSGTVWFWSGCCWQLCRPATRCGSRGRTAQRRSPSALRRLKDDTRYAQGKGAMLLLRG